MKARDPAWWPSFNKGEFVAVRGRLFRVAQCFRNELLLERDPRAVDRPRRFPTGELVAVKGHRFTIRGVATDGCGKQWLSLEPYPDLPADKLEEAVRLIKEAARGVGLEPLGRASDGGYVVSGEQAREIERICEERSRVMREGREHWDPPQFVTGEPSSWFNVNPLQSTVVEVLFDGPPGPKGGRFVEVEVDGHSSRLGVWVEKGRYWALRFNVPRGFPHAPLFDLVQVDALIRLWRGRLRTARKKGSAYLEAAAVAHAYADAFQIVRTCHGHPPLPHEKEDQT